MLTQPGELESERFMAIEPGQRLGPYEILAPIGAGGMGEVYRAKDSRLERDVAIKVLPPSFSQDALSFATATIGCLRTFFTTPTTVIQGRFVSDPLEALRSE